MTTPTWVRSSTVWGVRRLGRWRFFLSTERRVWVAIPILLVFVLLALFPQWFDLAGPRPCLLARSLDRPSLAHPFGFDLQGCDLFARTVHGTRNSLLVGVGAVGGAAVLAVIFGSIAGAFGGAVDAIIRGAADLLTGIPVVLVGIVVVTATQERGVPHVLVVLTIFGWPLLTRVVRAEVLRVRQMEFVIAARALGAGRATVLRRHIVPNATGPLIAAGILLTATMITTEAVITFIGAGLKTPTVSWGVVLAHGRGRIGSAPHLLLPGTFLVVAVGALILLGDALREARPSRYS